jgi:hypothetical protein
MDEHSAGKRRMYNYLFMSRSRSRNIGYSAGAATKPRTPEPGLLYKMKDFLTYNRLAWFFRNWRIIKRFEYPKQVTRSLHQLRNASGAVPLFGQKR